MIRFTIMCAARSLSKKTACFHLKRSLHEGGSGSSGCVLQYTELKHKSVEINIANVESLSDGEEFEGQLENTLNDIRKNQYNAAFLSIPMDKSSLIEPAGRLGFRYHHAEGDLAKLYLWMADFENKIPAFGTHSCGVGGVVLLKGTNKLLVVKEHPPYNVNWKLPGGYANLGEDFCEASVREVWEETGVKSRFQSILAFRHSHAQQFGRSNLYVICLLEASPEETGVEGGTEEGEGGIRVDAEIEAAQWMDLEEYRNSTEHPMSQLIVDLVMEHRGHQAMTDLSASTVEGERKGEQNENIFLGLKEKDLSSVLSGPLPYKFYHI